MAGLGYRMRRAISVSDQVHFAESSVSGVIAISSSGVWTECAAHPLVVTFMEMDFTCSLSVSCARVMKISLFSLSVRRSSYGMDTVLIIFSPASMNSALKLIFRRLM